jgi:formylmethanofuran:tetrahydromethanopterin formyltransferase
MRPEREPADWAAERQTIRRLGEALLLAPTTDLFNALQVALDAVTEALDAAERRTDTEWLGQRARGAVAVLHAIASQVIQS